MAPRTKSRMAPPRPPRIATEDDGESEGIYQYSLTSHRLKGCLVICLFASSQREANAQAYLLAEEFSDQITVERKR